jgi:hypothetical protein
MYSLGTFHLQCRYSQETQVNQQVETLDPALPSSSLLCDAPFTFSPVYCCSYELNLEAVPPPSSSALSVIFIWHM